MRRLARLLLCLALVVRSGPAAEPAEDLPTVASLARAHAARLTEVAAAAKEARLGSIALPLFEDAMALDPQNAAARAALGWTRDASGWRPPDPRVSPALSWPDDGEADLAKVEKRVAAARAEHVRACMDAAAALKAKKASTSAVEAVLWSAIAADPAAPAPRQALAHALLGRTWRAPEHAFLSDPARVAAYEALPPAATRPPDLLDAVPPAPVAGWATPVPTGRAPLGGDAAWSLTDAGLPEAVAARLFAARAVLGWALGDAAGAKDPLPPFAFLHVGSRELANALLDAEPSMTPDGRALARLVPAWPLGTTGYVLVAAAGPVLAADAAVGILALRAVSVRGRSRDELHWLAEGLAYVVTTRLLGASHGRASLPHGFAGDVGPVRRDEETVPAFVRRMVATTCDPALADVAAKTGTFLEYLWRRDPEALRRFLAGATKAQGAGPARLRAGVAAAAFPDAPDLAALEEAFRRYALDALPVPEAGSDAAGGPWRVTRLERAKALPDVASSFSPLSRPVTGALWFGGRTHLCEVVEDGQAVRLQALELGKPSRVVREPGVVPFNVPLEYGGGTREVRVDLRREGPAWTVRAADAWAGAVDGHPLTFLDLDLDGRYGGYGRDAYVEGKGGFALPLRRTVVLGSKAYELRRVGPDGREVAWRAKPLAAKGPDLDALLAWNAWRTAAGLPALEWSAEDAAAARKDGAEDPRLRASADGLAALLERFARDLDRRAILLDPTWTHVGAATADGVTALRGGGPDARPDDAPFRGPSLFPPPGAQGLPRSGPGGEADGGLRISIHFPPGTDVAARKVEIALATAAGAAVPGASVPGAAAFAPAAPLQASATYRVTASWSEGAERVARSWTFVTGR